jgi:hypothetical protein
VSRNGNGLHLYFPLAVSITSKEAYAVWFNQLSGLLESLEGVKIVTDKNARDCSRFFYGTNHLDTAYHNEGRPFSISSGKETALVDALNGKYSEGSGEAVAIIPVIMGKWKELVKKGYTSIKTETQSFSLSEIPSLLKGIFSYDETHVKYIDDWESGRYGGTR